jgi:hypothetical protein
MTENNYNNNSLPDLRQPINNITDEDNPKDYNQMRYATDDLYNALQHAETGHLEGDDKWVRTEARGTGSSAYGPVQINKAMLTGVGYGDVGFSPEEHNWIQNTYIPQMDKFLQYGGGDMVEGMERYDYSDKPGRGRGDFTEDDRVMYDSMAKKLMKFEYDRAGGDMDKFIHAWRGETEDVDPEYYEKVRGRLPANNEEEIVNEVMDSNSRVDDIYNY